MGVVKKLGVIYFVSPSLVDVFDTSLITQDNNSNTKTTRKQLCCDLIVTTVVGQGYSCLLSGDGGGWGSDW